MRDQIVEHLDDLRSEAPAAFVLATAEAEPVPPPAVAAARAADPSRGPFVRAVIDLTSGDPGRIRTILGAEAPLPAPLVAFAHGTVLEYLETVLPDQVRDLVWPFLGEERPMRPARPAQEILADIVRHREAPAFEVPPAPRRLG